MSEKHRLFMETTTSINSMSPGAKHSLECYTRVQAATNLPLDCVLPSPTVCIQMQLNTA